MKHQITPFQFGSITVRVVTDESGNPLFVGKDVCEALGYVRSSDALQQHCKGAAIYRPLQTEGGRQSLRVLEEGDMFRLVVNSTLPSAQAFERLVFDEILPAIRKTGGYTAPAAKAKAQTLNGAAAAFKSMHSIAKLIGLEGNQAVLCANNAVFKHEGVNCLELLGQTALTAEDQRGRTYTATQIGNCFLGLSGGCGAKVNKMLEQSGVMKRGEGNRPEPTEVGIKHGEWADTGKHHGGSPVKEWRWFDTVIPFVQRSAA